MAPNGTFTGYQDGRGDAACHWQAAFGFVYVAASSVKVSRPSRPATTG